MLITDQVATAPCTDPIQVAIPTFEEKPRVYRAWLLLRLPQSSPAFLRPELG